MQSWLLTHANLVCNRHIIASHLDLLSHSHAYMQMVKMLAKSMEASLHAMHCPQKSRDLELAEW